MFSNPHQVDFRSLGRRKIALFINVSDTDRSNDKLLNLLYSQALHELCDSADCSPDGRLKVPVRFIMDDFAANAVIPDFDKVISVIRSREIYVSLILQSLSQLDSMYGKDRAMTIINNCDSCLYLGGQDVPLCFSSEARNLSRLRNTVWKKTLCISNWSPLRRLIP